MYTYKSPLFIYIKVLKEIESSLESLPSFHLWKSWEHKDLFKLYIYWFCGHPFCLKGHEVVVYYLNATTCFKFLLCVRQGRLGVKKFGWCNVKLVKFRTCESFLLQLVYVSEFEYFGDKHFCASLLTMVVLIRMHGSFGFVTVDVGVSNS